MIFTYPSIWGRGWRFNPPHRMLTRLVALLLIKMGELGEWLWDAV